jgi:hypothetical protein
MEGEPFATFRAFPVRFGVGLPLVFFGALAVALLLVPVHISLAAAALLVLQTGGFLLLYVPALRARSRDLQHGAHRPGSDASRGDAS